MNANSVWGSYIVAAIPCHQLKHCPCLSFFPKNQRLLHELAQRIALAFTGGFCSTVIKKI
jgi:hypothetical protein